VPPLIWLRTDSAAALAGSPSGTVTVSRRHPRDASTVATADAGIVLGLPVSGVKVTRLLAASASNPVPVIEIATPGEAPSGLKAINEADCPARDSSATPRNAATAAANIAATATWPRPARLVEGFLSDTLARLR
jgi:hypothetical protein